MTDDRFSQDFSSPESQRVLRLLSNANFDPLTATMLSVAGSGMSAIATLAGGSAAATMGRMQQAAAQFQATQDIQQSASDTAAAQRQSLDILQKGNLLRSTAVASAAAGGVETTTGSPLDTQAQIATRSKYSSELNTWEGQNKATGDLNKAAAAEYSGQMDLMGGQMAQEASEFSAAGTLATGGTSAYKLYMKQYG